MNETIELIGKLGLFFMGIGLGFVILGIALVGVKLAHLVIYE